LHGTGSVAGATFDPEYAKAGLKQELSTGVAAFIRVMIDPGDLPFDRIVMLPTMLLLAAPTGCRLK
jgi:hypothetical protein